jgi:hypothetical protein
MERQSASFVPLSLQKDPVGPGAFSVSGRHDGRPCDPVLSGSLCRGDILCRRLQ